MKKIFFLAGLQRSGATLLSSILNQNPSIWTSPASPLFRMLDAQVSALGSGENIDYDRSDAIKASISMSAREFYADKSSDFIIDKNLNWQTVRGLSLISEFITKEPKIICPVRSIPEILASFDTVIKAVSENANNAIDAEVLAQTAPIGSLADRRAEWLMRYDKDIPVCIEGMKLALNPELRNMFLFVEYDDLISNTKEQISRIYEFLGIPKFEHEYSNIFDPTNISENSPVTGIKYLHKVRPKIEKKSLPPEEVLSREIINKYSGWEFWRNL